MTDQKSAATTVREATLRFLRQAGLTTCFGNPGSTELTLFRDWPDDFRYILGLQESVVVGMADGFAQATGQAAFVNLHSAAGVGHALGAIYTAYTSQTPMVITAGQQARELLPFDPFLGARRPTEFPQPYIKWAIEPARPQDVPAAIARAYYIAMQEPRGPTLVSVPSDDWDAEAEFVAPPRVVSNRARPDPAAIAAVAEVLSRAVRPVIVTGADVDRSGAWDDVVALAEKTQATVWGAPHASRTGFPERHPQFAGLLVANRAAIRETLEGHDVALVIGAPAFAFHTASDGPFLPEGCQLIQLVNDKDMAAWTPEGTSIVANVAASVKDLLTLVTTGPKEPPKGRGPRPEIPPSDPISPDYLIHMLERLRPQEACIAEEAPSTRLAIRDHLPIDRPASFVATSSGGLGFALAGAVGFGLARPGEKVIALIGDGSAMYAIQALWSAVEYKVPVAVVIVNNEGYGAMKRFGRQLNVTPVGIEIKGLDFVKLAQGHGVRAERVTHSSELEAALTRAFAADEPYLVDVAVAGP